ncbi:diacylglycerol kinase [Acidaminobacter sp. JC074]|uniref:diacylglycerol kinase n=1 Tax=Acidaminobacter sp. JC074 TaxID=2530199 RepID=UPI001F105AD4|nr:diacylglycerol kinase family protein [Acidaminobacter sp. JC074]
MKNRKFLMSFKNAWQGLITAFKDERNFRIELVMGIMVIILSFILKISILEWTAIVFCIVLVLIAELFNSALEHLVDLFSPEYHEHAKKAKDIAAAAVLTISMGTVVIGSIIFIPKLLSFF